MGLATVLVATVWARAREVATFYIGGNLESSEMTIEGVVSFRVSPATTSSRCRYVVTSRYQTTRVVDRLSNIFVLDVPEVLLRVKRLCAAVADGAR